MGRPAPKTRSIPQASPQRIVATPEVCGGAWRVAGTRIPIWVLARYREQGVKDETLLDDYPALSPADLAAVWKFLEEHPETAGA